MELTDRIPKNCVLGAALFPMFINGLKKGPIVKIKRSLSNKIVGQASENKGWSKIYQVIFESGEAR